MEQEKPKIRSVANGIIHELNEKRETSSGKASLAKLRNSAGRSLSASSQVWPIVLDRMPEEFLGSKGDTTAEEKALITALQLYALHQQGESETVILPQEDGKWRNIGYSLSALRTKDDQAGVDRRFSALITSSTFEELTHHLRHIIKLLKSKTKSKVDYSQLAEDLYWFLRGYQDGVKLNWARGYYGTKIKGESDNERQ